MNKQSKKTKTDNERMENIKALYSSSLLQDVLKPSMTHSRDNMDKPLLTPRKGTVSTLKHTYFHISNVFQGVPKQSNNRQSRNGVSIKGGTRNLQSVGDVKSRTVESIPNLRQTNEMSQKVLIPEGVK